MSYQAENHSEIYEWKFTQPESVFFESTEDSDELIEEIPTLDKSHHPEYQSSQRHFQEHVWPSRYKPLNMVFNERHLVGSYLSATSDWLWRNCNPFHEVYDTRNSHFYYKSKVKKTKFDEFSDASSDDEETEVETEDFKLTEIVNKDELSDIQLVDNLELLRIQRRKLNQRGEYKTRYHSFGDIWCSESSVFYTFNGFGMRPRPWILYSMYGYCYRDDSGALHNGLPSDPKVEFSRKGILLRFFRLFKMYPRSSWYPIYKAGPFGFTTRTLFGFMRSYAYGIKKVIRDTTLLAWWLIRATIKVSLGLPLLAIAAVGTIITTYIVSTRNRERQHLPSRHYVHLDLVLDKFCSTMLRMCQQYFWRNIHLENPIPYLTTPLAIAITSITAVAVVASLSIVGVAWPAIPLIPSIIIFAAVVVAAVPVSIVAVEIASAILSRITGKYPSEIVSDTYHKVMELPNKIFFRMKKKAKAWRRNMINSTAQQQTALERKPIDISIDPAMRMDSDNFDWESIRILIADVNAGRNFISPTNQLTLARIIQKAKHDGCLHPQAVTILNLILDYPEQDFYRQAAATQTHISVYARDLDADVAAEGLSEIQLNLYELFAATEQVTPTVGDNASRVTVPEALSLAGKPCSLFAGGRHAYDIKGKRREAQDVVDSLIAPDRRHGICFKASKVA